MIRAVVGVAITAASLFIGVAPCSAQLGLGGRMTMVRGDAKADAAALRFFGGQLRMPLSKRASLEVSLDRRTDSNEDLTERVVDIPLQGSVMLSPSRSTFAPYVIGGVGWHTHRVEQLSAGKVSASETSRRFGYHAGIGAELKLGRHAGVHGDYRYTFLKFGDADEEESLLSRFKPSYEGSMWTAGLTIYF